MYSTIPYPLLPRYVYTPPSRADDPPPTYRNADPPSSDQSVPDWLYQSLRSKFPDSEAITKNDIHLATARMKKSNEVQILAFVNAGVGNGVFSIYEPVNGEYKEVYTQNFSVTGLQLQGLTHQPVVLTVVQAAGTGYGRYYFYIIRYTSRGYQIVWNGLAQSFEFLPGQTNFDTTGSLNFSNKNEFVYSRVTRVYESPDQAQSRVTEKTAEIYKYNPSTDRYELVKRA